MSFDGVVSSDDASMLHGSAVSDDSRKAADTAMSGNVVTAAGDTASGIGGYNGVSEGAVSGGLASRLSGLKPVRRIVRSGMGGSDEFRFRISIARGNGDAASEAYLSVVDNAGNETIPDRGRVSAAAGRLLDAMAEVRSGSGFMLGWEGVDNNMSLTRYPMLGQLLMECNNIEVDGRGPVAVRRDMWRLRLTLDRVKGEDGATLRFEPVLTMLSDGGEEPGDDAGMSRGVRPEMILSRQIVLDGNELCGVADLGENFNATGMFLDRIPAAGLNQWLSLFFTYIDNVEVWLDGRPVEWGSHEVGYVPAIVFTKVDADRSLNMEVARVLPGIDFNLQRRLQLTAVAVDDADGRPMICRTLPYARHEAEADADDVDGKLRYYTPSRAAYKNVYRDGTFFIVPPEIAGPFLLHGLPSLLRDFSLIGSEKLREYKIQPVFPKIKVRMSSGINFLDTEASVSVGDEKIGLPELLNQYREQRFVMLSDGNRGILDDRYMRRLQRIFKVEGKGDEAAVKVSYFDIPEIEALLQEGVEGEAPQHYREFLEGFNALGSRALPLTRLNAELRPYQLEGVKWMAYLGENGMGGCLADDMGLGKTVQTIALLTMVYGTSHPEDAPRRRGRPRKQGGARTEAERNVAPSLLVMPKSLIFNWESEIKRFAPWLRTYTYYAAERDIDEACKADVVITTYGMLRNDIDTLRRCRWEYVVLDESQNIKNMDSQTAKAASILKANHRLALSGTPMENNIMELYSLFRFLNPGMLGDPADFSRRYAVPIENEADADAMTALRRKIYPFMLRRLKRDVLTELPDLTEQTIYTEMEPAHARFYEERRLYYQGLINKSIEQDGVQKSQFVIFQALSELRRIASIPNVLTDGTVTSPKLDPLVETISEAAANGHKSVVFFNFIAGIELVGERLERLGIDYATMTGSTGDRRSVIRRFQTDPECRVLLLTLKVGGVGLNLTAADTVFIYEPWWNRAAEKQAIDRLHRMGQKMKVTSYSMITRNTIEERIRQLQERKAELFDGLVSADPTLSKQISQEDINFILS